MKLVFYTTRSHRWQENKTPHNAWWVFTPNPVPWDCTLCEGGRLSTGKQSDYPGWSNNDPRAHRESVPWWGPAKWITRDTNLMMRGRRGTILKGQAPAQHVLQTHRSSWYWEILVTGKCWNERQQGELIMPAQKGISTSQSQKARQDSRCRLCKDAFEMAQHIMLGVRCRWGRCGIFRTS